MGLVRTRAGLHQTPNPEGSQDWFKEPRNPGYGSDRKKDTAFSSSALRFDEASYVNSMHPLKCDYKAVKEKNEIQL